MLPPVVLAAIFIAYYFIEQRAHLTEDSMVGVRQLVSAVDRELASTEVALGVLATSPSLAVGDFAAFRQQANAMQAIGLVTSITLVDMSGRPLVSTHPKGEQDVVSPVQKTQIETALETGRWVFTDASGLSNGGLPQANVVVAVPNYPIRLALVGIVNPARIQKILTGQRFSDDRAVIVFDSLALVTARSREIGRYIGKSVSPALLAALAKSPEGNLETVTLDGVPVVSVYSRSGVTGWGVAIGIPSRLLIEDLQRSIWLLAAFATALFGVSLGLAWFLGGRITKTMAALSGPALALGKGQAVSVPRLPIREADDVGQAIAKASQAIVDSASALITSESRMRGVLESAMDAIVTLDDHQNVVLFNTAACNMFGCSAADAIGQSITRFIPDRFHDRHFDMVTRPVAAAAGEGEPAVTGAPVTGVAVRTDGEEFPVEVSYSHAQASGSTWHTLIIRDITTRVRAYEALERSNTDLQQFAYVASHDLKTPLRSIGGFVQLLERNYAANLDEKALSLIHRTAQAASRLEQLTDDLLSYARLSSEAKPFAPVELDDVSAEVISLLDAVISESKAVVTLSRLPCVMGDHTQLVQLLLNLLGNGMKYCQGRTPTVQVYVRRLSHQWEFAVSDNGIGIEAKHYDRIFEVFKRLHTQKEYAGTGIGLAVCRRVVERHGGDIWVKSVVGEGSTFYFTLPVMLAESLQT